MRRFVLVAGLILLAGCGDSPTGNDVAGEQVPVPAPRNVAAAGDDNQQAPDASLAAQSSPVGSCRMQGTERLEAEPLRAIGTEPFWGARIEGRCVTYSHPDDQKGTRVWTRYSRTADGRGAWIGQLEGQRFELRTRPEPGCSDGMSDERYPIAVDLIVNGEQRQGCAEPL